MEIVIVCPGATFDPGGGFEVTSSIGRVWSGPNLVEYVSLAATELPAYSAKSNVASAPGRSEPPGWTHGSKVRLVTSPVSGAGREMVRVFPAIVAFACSVPP